MGLGAQNPIPEWDFSRLKGHSEQSTDTLYLYNFWATWCAPCVKEIPYFEHLAKTWTKTPIRILYVSLDLSRAYPDQLASFALQKNIKEPIVWLNAPGENHWIPQIDSSWTGAIPATLLWYAPKEKHAFYAFSFESPEDLIHWVEQSMH